MTAYIDARLEQNLRNKGVINYPFYTDQEDVLAELKRRQSLPIDDEKIRANIKPTPSIQRLLEKPHLVFFRQIATPSHETLRVIEIAKELGLDLCILEFHADKFVSANNQYKHSLGKLPVHQFVDKNHNDVFKYRTIVDFNTYTGHKFSEVTTLKGESLINFHHDLFTFVTGIDISTIAVDASDWFGQYDYTASNYYSHFFSLFIKNNVLAEVFLESKEECFFIQDVVEPAIENVLVNFNFTPLVVEYLPTELQASLFWDSYPMQIDEFMRQKRYD